jgi:hypothetical protein
MGGLAFLPWEKWLARAFHRFATEITKLSYKIRRRRTLIRSKAWPETEGIVESIQWDSSFPRQEISYSFTTDQGSYSGYDWVWFESPNDPQFHIGDKVVIRYVQDGPAESVLLKLN